MGGDRSISACRNSPRPRACLRQLPSAEPNHNAAPVTPNRWESPQLGYDDHAITIGASLACAPPGNPDPDARTGRRAWLLALDKAKLYTGAGGDDVTVAGWDLTSAAKGVRQVQPAVPQDKADVRHSMSGAAYAVALVRDGDGRACSGRGRQGPRAGRGTGRREEVQEGRVLLGTRRPFGL
jgi:hypothetical protein